MDEFWKSEERTVRRFILWVIIANAIWSLFVITAVGALIYILGRWLGVF